MNRKRIVTPEDVEHLPTEIHRKVAQQLIIAGEWGYFTSSYLGISELVVD